MKRLNSTIENNHYGTGVAPSDSMLLNVTYFPYGWVRIPAILLGGVGVLGILMFHLESAARLFSFLRMPPELYCYLITIGASLLFGISLIRHTTEKVIHPAAAKKTSLPTHWRSV